jgi:hypothetical protein
MEPDGARERFAPLDGCRLIAARQGRRALVLAQHNWEDRN